MHTRILINAVAALALLSLSACETTGNSGLGGTPAASSSNRSSPSNLSGYGVVQSIEMASPENTGLGVGAAAGAIVGGVLGNQIGKGKGNTAATIAGAAGGAYVGHEYEKSTRKTSQTYRITLRMDDGSLQLFSQEMQPNFRIGNRVHVYKGAIVK